MNPGYANLRSMPVGNLDVDTRAAFVSKTYLHLLGAILAFTGIEVALFQSGLAPRIAMTMLSGSWLLVLGGFVVVSWIATHMARSAESLAAQYAGLAFYVVAEAIIFVPLLYIANRAAPGVIESAALITILGFAGLTAVAMMTRKDFSFLGSFLMWAGVVAMVAIVAATIFGIHLGMFFSVLMIALAGAAILYDTSNVLHHYPEDRYVAASLQLFASVALMFWYVLRLLLAAQRD